MSMPMSNDILFEIFSWLPAKAVYKFRTGNRLVSKFPEETYFALKQAQKALLRDDTCFFIQPDITYQNNELHPLLGEELSSGVSNDVLLFLSNSVKILSSSNGLILCRVKCQNQITLFISNPITQSCLPIPTPEHLYKNPYCDIKIGLECSLDDCMIFLFYEDPDDWSSYYCKIYLLKEGIWKDREEKIFVGGRNLRFDTPVYHNGAIHFISDSFPYFSKKSAYFRPYIMSYNLNNGKSSMLRIAREARKGSHDCSCNMRIFNWDKITSSNRSICLVRLRKHVFTIWVLTKYETCLWKRILKVRVKAMGLFEKDPIITGFVVLNGDLLVFATKKKVYGYGLSGKRYMKIEEICEHGCESNVHFISYSNTLRMWDAGVGTLPLPLYGSPKESISSLIQPYI
ncbi:hypothetical protein VNO77_01292 [Canavalia gladiata]|uniref:F-box protein At3g26010-like beta-propeller domain-containing protein n=1 Tax=Canavalia gladiata TaxID=3824 RepID=A0AAN9MRL7_CANGL